MILSTAISDGVLCLVTLWATWRMARAGHAAAALSLGLIAIPAAMGALRFGGLAELADLHQRASYAAAVSALPTFCIAFAFGAWKSRALAIMHVPWLVGVFVLAAAFITWPMYATVIGASGLVLAVAGAVASRRLGAIVWTVIAAAVYAAAGLVIGTTGEWRGIARVDLYHYALAGANIAFAFAIDHLVTRASRRRRSA